MNQTVAFSYRVSVCSLSILTICNFSYFPFWFFGLDLGSDCFSSSSLHTFYFYNELRGLLRFIILAIDGHRVNPFKPKFIISITY